MELLQLKISDGKLGVRPDVVKPHPGFFDQVGEERFRKLVDDHYEKIRTSDIGFLFPIHDEDDFNEAKRNATEFLMEISGGPTLYTDRKGEARMVGRHAPFRIDEKARRRWLEFYAELLPPLELEGVKREYIQSFWDYLDTHSKWMINVK